MKRTVTYDVQPNRQQYTKDEINTEESRIMSEEDRLYTTQWGWVIGMITSIGLKTENHQEILQQPDKGLQPMEKEPGPTHRNEVRNQSMEVVQYQQSRKEMNEPCNHRTGKVNVAIKSNRMDSTYAGQPWERSNTGDVPDYIHSKFIQASIIKTATASSRIYREHESLSIIVEWKRREMDQSAPKAKLKYEAQQQVNINICDHQWPME
jgi:hypothetical protein